MVNSLLDTEDPSLPQRFHSGSLQMASCFTNGNEKCLAHGECMAPYDQALKRFTAPADSAQLHSPGC